MSSPRCSSCTLSELTWRLHLECRPTFAYLLEAEAHGVSANLLEPHKKIVRDKLGKSLERWQKLVS